MTRSSLLATVGTWKRARRRRAYPAAAAAASTMGRMVRWASTISPVDQVDVVDIHHDHDPHPSWSDVSTWMAQVLRPYFEQQRPLLFKRAVLMAPAISKWQSWDYWKQAISPTTTASVEIGGSYHHHSSTQRVEIPVRDYLDYLQLFEERHGKQQQELHDNRNTTTTISNDELVYMAQNDLLTELQDDVLLPDFCSQSGSAASVGLGRLYSTMLWLGPQQSTSPLHYDPLDNLLMQYVGRKVVYLYEPIPGPWIYAGQEAPATTSSSHETATLPHQTNTSPVNPEIELQYESVDESDYPLFHTHNNHNKNGHQCILEPGDVLYIPSKWWHYVRSLDTSASVNVWWR